MERAGGKPSVVTADRVVGLLVGGPRPDELDYLIREVGRTFRVVNAADDSGRIDWAFVFRSPFTVPETIPTVWFIADRSDIPSVRRPAVVLSAHQDLLDAVETGAPKVLLRSTLVRCDAPRPFAPYPRDRVRRARGLPPVVRGEVTAERCLWNGAAVGPALRSTVLAASSAVIADSSSLLEALAFAAPIVTDPESAAGLGARHEEHVLIGSDEQERQQELRRLAEDPILAARLSWAGRQLFESHSVTHLIARIDSLIPSTLGPRDRVTTVLDSLGTPHDAPIRARAAQRGDWSTSIPAR
jgi:hypothetical protein